MVEAVQLAPAPPARPLAPAAAPKLPPSGAFPARDPRLILTPGQPDVLHAQPREVLTLSFHVRSLSNRPVTIDRELQLGATFRRFGPQVPFHLGVGETATLLAHFQIPGDARTGDHGIRLLLRDRCDAGLRAEWRAVVHIG